MLHDFAGTKPLALVNGSAMFCSTIRSYFCRLVGLCHLIPLPPNHFLLILSSNEPAILGVPNIWLEKRRPWRNHPRRKTNSTEVLGHSWLPRTFSGWFRKPMCGAGAVGKGENVDLDEFIGTWWMFNTMKIAVARMLSYNSKVYITIWIVNLSWITIWILCFNVVEWQRIMEN